MAAAGG
jgi:hypothetical protein